MLIWNHAYAQTGGNSTKTSFEVLGIVNELAIRLRSTSDDRHISSPLSSDSMKPPVGYMDAVTARSTASTAPD